MKLFGILFKTVSTLFVKGYNLRWEKLLLNNSDVEMMNRYSFSTFIHGAAHLVIAYRDYTKDQSYMDSYNNPTKPNLNPSKLKSVHGFSGCSSAKF